MDEARQVLQSWCQECTDSGLLSIEVVDVVAAPGGLIRANLVLTDDRDDGGFRLDIPSSFQSGLSPSEMVFAVDNAEEYDAWQEDARGKLAQLGADCSIQEALVCVRKAYTQEEDDDEYGYYDGDGYAEDDAVDEEEQAAQLAKIQEQQFLQRLKDAEIRVREEERGMALPSSAKHVQSIFSSAEAGTILISEIKELRERGPDEGIMAEPVEMDPYHWRLILRDFAPKSAMARGLRQLVEVHGYDHVEIDVRFAKGLYPFFPPLIQVRRPRLAGASVWRVQNIPDLRLEHWRPIRADGMITVARSIKQHLADWGSIDAASPLSALDTPSGSYSELEQLAFMLGVATETAPRAGTFDMPVYTGVAAGAGGADGAAAAGEAAAAVTAGAAAAKPAKPAQPAGETASAEDTKKQQKGKYWAKGVGYSTNGRDTGWDPAAYRAAQAEKDRRLQMALRCIAAYLDTDAEAPASRSGKKKGGNKTRLPQSPDAGKAKPPKPKRGPSFSRRGAVGEAVDEPQQLAEQLRGDREDRAAAVRSLKDPPAVRKEVVSRCAETLGGCCLLPLIAQHLSNDSLVDLEMHRMLHKVLLELVRQLAAHECLRPILRLPTKPLRATTSVAREVRARAGQARLVLEAEAAAGQAGEAAEEAPPYLLMADIVATADFMEAQFRAGGLDPTEEVVVPSGEEAAAAAGGAGAGGEEEEEADAEAVYVATMRPLQYAFVDRLAGYKYESDAKAVAGSRDRKRLRRIGQEHSTFSGSGLPCNASSSVFVRAPRARLDTMQALIVGPEGSPYSGGCFLFNIFLPEVYPNGPPLCYLARTHGHRYNPNLYADGKVCLSLLGTWSGSHGENWEPRTSTVLQMLISIQALILVPDPYFNEPGYQSTMGTPSGDAASAQYDDQQKLATVRFAMMDMLQKPQPGFEEIIRTHFRLRRDYLTRQVGDWVADARKRRSSVASALGSAFNTLKGLLKAL